MLDLNTGILTTPVLSLVQTVDPTGKQVRQNSKDLSLAEQLAIPAMAAAKRSQVVFAEVPVGSQSARAMASYGVCVGILGCIRAEGIPIIEVTPMEVKKTFTGDRNATKDQMIQAAIGYYPEANFPRHRGIVSGKAEHVSDAIAAIHAGVQTPEFQHILRILNTV